MNDNDAEEVVGEPYIDIFEGCADLSELERFLAFIDSELVVKRCYAIDWLEGIINGLDFQKHILGKVVPSIEEILNDNQNLAQAILLRAKTLDKLPFLIKHLTEKHGSQGYRTVVKKLLPIAAQPFLSSDRSLVNHAIRSMVTISKSLKHKDLVRYMMESIVPRSVAAGLSSDNLKALSEQFSDENREALVVAGLSLAAHLVPLLDPDEARRYSFSLVSSVARPVQPTPFHLRRVAVAALALLPPFLAQRVIDTDLLQLQLELSTDPLWGIRRASLSPFPALAQAVSPHVLSGPLSQTYLKLCCDDLDWVRKSALLALPPFLRAFLPDQPYHVDDASGHPMRSRVDLKEPIAPPACLVAVVGALPWALYALSMTSDGEVAVDMPSVTPGESDDDSDTDDPVGSLDASSFGSSLSGLSDWDSPGPTSDQELAMITGEVVHLAVQVFGPSIWPSVQRVVPFLAHHTTNWHVRAGVARHIHDLAHAVIGQTGALYWWGWYELFITDVDDVRLIVVQHTLDLLRSFLSVAGPDGDVALGGDTLSVLLPQVLGAVILDGDGTWRCRAAAVKVACGAQDLFPCLARHQGLLDAILAACSDPVASVRTEAAAALGHTIVRLEGGKAIDDKARRSTLRTALTTLIDGSQTQLDTAVTTLGVMAGGCPGKAVAPLATRAFHRHTESNTSIRLQVARLVAHLTSMGIDIKGMGHVRKALAADPSIGVRNIIDAA